MIRPCSAMDFPVMLEIINEAAHAYRGVIPADCWAEPYMPEEEFMREIEGGVRFWGYVDAGELVGVMGIQHVRDVSLIRHAYVRTAKRQNGIGGKLLGALRAQTALPLLMGTWAAADWAVRFYEKHGFRMVAPDEKDSLLKKYWNISDRQVEMSVVLADRAWFERKAKGKRLKEKE
jgi:N-acetylglutamate synthase-like GNAT family acetyltransferase